MKKFSNHCADVFNKSLSLSRDIDVLNELKSDLSYLPNNKIKENRIKLQMLSELKSLSLRIKKLFTEIEKEATQ